MIRLPHRRGTLCGYPIVWFDNEFGRALRLIIRRTIARYGRQRRRYLDAAVEPLRRILLRARAQFLGAEHHQKWNDEPFQKAVRHHSVNADRVASSDPDGNRTRVSGVKGRCPRPLDDGASSTTGRAARLYSGLPAPTSRGPVQRELRRSSWTSVLPVSGTGCPGRTRQLLPLLITLV